MTRGVPAPMSRDLSISLRSLPYSVLSPKVLKRLSPAVVARVKQVRTTLKMLPKLKKKTSNMDLDSGPDELELKLIGTGKIADYIFMPSDIMKIW